MLILVLAVLAVSLVVGKNVLLNEVRNEVRKTLTYDRLKLSYFPPALVVENLRSIAEPASIRVRRVRIEVPYMSLLRNRKVLSVVLDSPELRIKPRAKDAPRRKPRPPLSILSLPFVIEQGLVENGSIVFETGGDGRSPGHPGPRHPGRGGLHGPGDGRAERLLHARAGRGLPRRPGRPPDREGRERDGRPAFDRRRRTHSRIHGQPPGSLRSRRRARRPFRGRHRDPRHSPSPALRLAWGRGRGRADRAAGRPDLRGDQPWLEDARPVRRAHGRPPGPLRARPGNGRLARSRLPEAGTSRREPEPDLRRGPGRGPGGAALRRSGHARDRHSLAGRFSRLGRVQPRGPQARGRGGIPGRIARTERGPLRLPRRRHGRRRLRRPSRQRRRPGPRIELRPVRGDGGDRPQGRDRHPDPGPDRRRQGDARVRLARPRSGVRLRRDPRQGLRGCPAQRALGRSGRHHQGHALARRLRPFRRGDSRSRRRLLRGRLRRQFRHRRSRAQGPGPGQDRGRHARSGRPRRGRRAGQDPAFPRGPRGPGRTGRGGLPPDRHGGDPGILGVFHEPRSHRLRRDGPERLRPARVEERGPRVPRAGDGLPRRAHRRPAVRRPGRRPIRHRRSRRGARFRDGRSRPPAAGCPCPWRVAASSAGTGFPDFSASPT
ncbi:MAG: hypothetical protein MZU95_07170 [Desulfomicrobium escambiense]|nr:hypothetical protein [Desulfomicrobium escambiense]